MTTGKMRLCDVKIIVDESMSALLFGASANQVKIAIQYAWQRATSPGVTVDEVGRPLFVSP